MRNPFVCRFLMGAAALLLSTSALAEDRWLGTWKLNVARSHYSPGAPPRSTTIKLENTERGLKYTSDGVDALGTRTHIEYIARFDGQDYPFKGSQAADTIVLRRIDDSTYEAILKKSGAIVTTATTVISRDGRTRVTTQRGKNAEGAEIYNTIVYDRQ